MTRSKRKKEEEVTTAYVSLYNFLGFHMGNFHCAVGWKGHSLCGLMGEVRPGQEP